MEKLQSLHSHTKNSDGQYNHQELLEAAKKYNVNAIAFTDHDGIISPSQVDSIKDVKDITWVSGIEISSGLPLDLGGGPSSSFHIVGLFINYEYPPLKEYCKNAQEGRIERMRRMINNLNNIEFKITEEDCVKQSGGEAVARPHIVKALLSYKENWKRMDEIKEDMKKASEDDPALKDKFNSLLETPKERWPYTLFLTEDSFIKDVYVDNLFYLDMDKSVELIRNAGGIAILAHYFTCSNKLNEKYLEEIIKEKRIDGIETVFGLHAYGTFEEQKILGSMEITERIANKYNCLKSGGADIHTEEDLKKFEKTRTFSEKTVGLLEKMMKSTKLNLEFSNITDFKTLVN